jgi:hypothetical protein
MKIFEAPVLEPSVRIPNPDLSRKFSRCHLRRLQQFLDFRIIDFLDLVVINKILLFTFMIHDLVYWSSVLRMS